MLAMHFSSGKNSTRTGAAVIGSTGAERRSSRGGRPLTLSAARTARPGLASTTITTAVAATTTETPARVAVTVEPARTPAATRSILGRVAAVVRRVLPGRWRPLVPQPVGKQAEFIQIDGGGISFVHRKSPATTKGFNAGDKGVQSDRSASFHHRAGCASHARSRTAGKRLHFLFSCEK